MKRLLLESTKLPPEVEYGNVEYKLKLVNTKTERQAQLTSQLKWRLSQGNGTAIYELGVADDGTLVGLSRVEMDETLYRLKMMAMEISSSTYLVSEKMINDKYCCEVEVRHEQENTFVELRIVMLGAYDAGKSTLLSVLCFGESDDGRGAARVNMMRHLHEIKSGKSSAISRQIIGFDTKGDLINYNDEMIVCWEDIIVKSCKVITFLDTCGDPKYETTTIKGLTGEDPHYVCVIISACVGRVLDVCKQQIIMAKHLHKPLIVIITKIDASSHFLLENTLKELTGILQILGNPVKVITKESDIDVELIALNKVIPMILVSSVTQDNIGLLTTFFNRLEIPKLVSSVGTQDLVFRISDVFNLPETGYIVAGALNNGRMQFADTTPLQFLLGPDVNHKFIKVLVTSLQRHRCNVKHLDCGQHGTAAIKFVSNDGIITNNLPKNFKLKPGQVLISSDTAQQISKTIKVDLHLVCHPTALTKGQELTFYCESVKQRVKIIRITQPIELDETTDSGANNDDLKLNVGGFGRVEMQFCVQGEFLKLGGQVLLLGAGIKCVGSIVAIQPL